MTRFPFFSVSAVAALVLTVAIPVAVAAEIPSPLDSVKSWGYLLDNVNPQEVAASGFDLIVIDYSADGSEAGEFTPGDLAAMQRKPDGSRRLVLAYLSIGEAETYRYYWKPQWEQQPPAWLDDENPDWEGNIKVRFWDPGWQKLIFGNREAYLDRILRAGFDGVYLDLIDAFEFFEKRRPNSRAEMAGFVSKLSSYVKRKGGRDFLVIGQNGESLVSEKDYLEAIDGIAKEDLYFSWKKDGVSADPEETAESLAHLRQAQAAGKKIFVAEYVSKRHSIAETYGRARGEGFIPHASRRALDRLVVNEGFDPASDGSITFQDYDGRFQLNDLSAALFFATTLPRGATRISIFSDYYTENYEFFARDIRGEERDFLTDDFFEWETSLALRHALTDQIELGFRLPIVYSEIDANPLPGEHRGYRRSETGLGNIGLLAAYGIEFGPDASDILLFDAEFGIPTDTRSDEFVGGGHTFGSLTYEHYWDRLGVTAIAGAEYYAESGYSGGEWEFNYLAGPSYQWSDRLYTAVLLGQRANFDILQIDVSASFLLTPRSSLEFYWGKDLEGPAGATFFGIGLNTIIGEADAAKVR